jgi:hypothetical protein
MTGEWRKLHDEELHIICTHSQILLGRPSQGDWGGRDMWHAWERREKCTRFWWESPNERGHLKDQVVAGRMGSEWILGSEISDSQGGDYEIRVFWVVEPCSHVEGDQSFRGAYCLHHPTSNVTTLSYIPEDSKFRILGRLTGGVDWIRLAQDRDIWRTVVNAMMNLRVLEPQS